MEECLVLAIYRWKRYLQSKEESLGPACSHIYMTGLPNGIQAGGGPYKGKLCPTSGGTLLGKQAPVCSWAPQGACQQQPF